MPMLLRRAHILLLALTLASCAPVVTAAERVLRIGMSADVTTFDPHFVAAQPNLNAQFHVFDALVQVDTRGRIAPGLAESWRTANPLTWEFKLRKGVRFHDGTELTADDVIYSLERPLNIQGSPGGFATYVRPIVKREAINRYTVRLTTGAPYGPLLQDLAQVMIVSRRAAEGSASRDFDSGRAAIGTGPYRLVQYVRADRIELARHEHYWGGATPWERVTLRILPADPVRTAALLAGSVDVIENVPPADLPRLQRASDLHLERTTSWRTLLLHLDVASDRPASITDHRGAPLQANPLRDIRIREAISLAIDRKALVDRILEGMGVPAAQVVSPSVFGHDATIEPPAYNLERARQLLQEAGYPEGFRIRLGAPNNRYVNDEQVAQACAQLLARIGIRADVDVMPLSIYLTRARRRDFGLALLGWGSLSADLALRSLAATPDRNRGYGAWNWGGHASRTLDDKIVRALNTVDERAREKLAQQAAVQAATEVAFVPLYYQVAVWAMRSDIRYAPRADEFTFAHQFSPR